MSYVHAGDKSVAELVRMVDDGVEQQVARHIVDHLMHLDYPGVAFSGFDGDGFDARIDGFELARPISAYLILSMDVATLHSVRPLHIGLHLREYGIDVTGVEIAIDG